MNSLTEGEPSTQREWGRPPKRILSRLFMFKGIHQLTEKMLVPRFQKYTPFFNVERNVSRTRWLHPGTSITTRLTSPVVSISEVRS